MDTSLNMPTQKSVGHDSHAATINDFNLHMRQQPWYQEWFRQQGLDPNHVQLSQAQRHGLQQLILQKGGVPPDAFNNMKIDPAGNLNTEHGFASQPTWLKGIEIAGAGVGAAFAAPAVLGALGVGGAAPGVAVPSITGTTYGTGMAAGLPSLAGMGTLPAVAGAGAGMTTGITGAAAPSLMSRIAGMAKNPASLLSSGGRALGAISQASASNRGTQIEAQMAHDQMQLEADQQRRAAESDAYRKTLYGQMAAGYQPSTRPAGAMGRDPNGFITDQARQAGQMLTDTSMAHLRNQDYPSITPMNQLPTKPGLMESIANYAGPAMSLFDPRLYDKNGTPIPHA